MNNLSKICWILGKNISLELSIREISQKAAVPYTTAYRLINKNKELFKIREQAGVKFCSLKLEDKIIKNYLAIAEREKTEEHLKKYPELFQLKKNLPIGDYTLILFGSRASEKQREKSDVDLCIINKDGKKNINFSSFETLYRLEVNPIFFTKREFIQMLKEKEVNVGKEILKNHIILYNENYFWEVVWNAI